MKRVLPLIMLSLLGCVEPKVSEDIIDFQVVPTFNRNQQPILNCVFNSPRTTEDIWSTLTIEDVKTRTPVEFVFLSKSLNRMNTSTVNQVDSYPLLLGLSKKGQRTETNYIAFAEVQITRFNRGDSLRLSLTHNKQNIEKIIELSPE